KMTTPLVVFAFLLASITASYAQQVRMAIQGGYGTEIEKGAVGASFEIFAIDRLSFAPGVNFYIPAEKIDIGGSDLKISYWEFNLDMHFYVVKSEDFGLYGIAGLNVLAVKAKLGNNSDSDNESGANLGLGISVGPGLPFIEAKYETVGDGQFFIGGGFRFPIN
ncbi:MAG TPA: outer membrane beta-barrel protein, partial [Cyclobacteriaceae bacterium]|nr:outer membrane beta-barrel protein [Cyclobacteriaceae bacterium]